MGKLQIRDHKKRTVKKTLLIWCNQIWHAVHPSAVSELDTSGEGPFPAQSVLAGKAGRSEGSRKGGEREKSHPCSRARQRNRIKGTEPRRFGAKCRQPHHEQMAAHERRRSGAHSCHPSNGGATREGHGMQLHGNPGWICRLAFARHVPTFPPPGTSWRRAAGGILLLLELRPTCQGRGLLHGQTVGEGHVGVSGATGGGAAAWPMATTRPTGKHQSLKMERLWGHKENQQTGLDAYSGGREGGCPTTKRSRRCLWPCPGFGPWLPTCWLSYPASARPSQDTPQGHPMPKRQPCLLSSEVGVGDRDSPPPQLPPPWDEAAAAARRCPSICDHN